MAWLAQQIDEWIDREFPEQETVSKRELLAHAEDSDLPPEAHNILIELPDAEQPKEQLHREIERMTHVEAIGGNAGGMEAGSSGEMRPGAYGAPPKTPYGGDWGGGYEP